VQGNKGQSVVHQWLDSTAGSIGQELLIHTVTGFECVCGEGWVCEERESFIIYRAGGACSWSAMCVLVYKEWFSVNSLKKNSGERKELVKQLVSGTKIHTHFIF